MNRRVDKAFTVVELLVVLSIIAVLFSLVAPATRHVRLKARSIQGSNNLRQMVTSLNLFAMDHRDRYPESVATIGVAEDWHWQEPTMLTGFHKRDPQGHRSLSGYLHGYIGDADTMYCPSAPGRYEYLQEAWDAGDTWDHPAPMTLPLDPLLGTYCFYWNYIGHLPDYPFPFRGPRGPDATRNRSTLMVSDYFGFDHWRARQTFQVSCYGSCEPLFRANVTAGTAVSSPYWARRGVDEHGQPCAPPKLLLRAGYSDGHVATYGVDDVIAMKVSLAPDGSQPYHEGVGPGVFFLPSDAVR